MNKRTLEYYVEERISLINLSNASYDAKKVIKLHLYMSQEHFTYTARESAL